MTEKLSVISTKQPDHKAEFVGYIREFADKVESGEVPIPDVALMYVSTTGYTPIMFASGTRATPMVVLATADLCREAALMHATAELYGTQP